MTTSRSDTGSFDARPFDARPATPGWSMRRTLTAGVLIVLALFAARLLVVRSFDSAPQPIAMADARRLPVALPDGRIVRLGDTLRPGVPTLISFWASWCGPCHSEAPAIAALRRRFGPGALNLVYLNVRDPGAAPATLAGMTRTAGLPAGGYAVMADDAFARFTNDLTGAIPRTYLFDRTGTPAAMIVGYKPLALARLAGVIAS